MNLATISTLVALIGSVTGAAFWLDDRHQHVDDARFMMAQTGMEFLDLRIQMLDLRIATEKLKPNKDADDREHIEQLKNEREALRQLKMQKENK